MQIRVVQIWGFLMTVLGWVFMACTMAMENWMNTSIGGLAGSYVMKQVSYYANLCHCYDFPVLWAVDVDIQIVRGLLIAALCLGMLGFVLSLMGMECTFIGGKDRSKHKIIFAGGWCHIISGKCLVSSRVCTCRTLKTFFLCFYQHDLSSGLIATCGYAVFMQYVLTYFNPDPDGLDYNLGSPVLLGWVGAAIHMTGGFFYLWSVWIQLCRREDK
uniref:Uncharacterized protein n=1 Tax=Monopterus albus TaxID=43700 RepID=A0A3Q3QJF2_MONAL